MFSLSLSLSLSLLTSVFYSYPDSIYLVAHAFLSSLSLSPSSLSIYCPPLIPSPFCEGPYMNLLQSSLYPSSSGGVYYRLVILCSKSKIHIWASTYPVPLFVTGLPHSGWFLQIPSICLWISRLHYFFLQSSIPLCKCATSSLSILQLRCI